jgi:hypothetical protein
MVWSIHVVHQIQYHNLNRNKKNSKMDRLIKIEQTQQIMLL